MRIFTVRFQPDGSKKTFQVRGHASLQAVCLEMGDYEPSWIARDYELPLQVWRDDASAIVNPSTGVIHDCYVYLDTRIDGGQHVIRKDIRPLEKQQERNIVYVVVQIRNSGAQVIPYSTPFKRMEVGGAGKGAGGSTQIWRLPDRGQLRVSDPSGAQWVICNNEGNIVVYDPNQRDVLHLRLSPLGPEIQEADDIPTPSDEVRTADQPSSVRWFSPDPIGDLLFELDNHPHVRGQVAIWKDLRAHGFLERKYPV